MKTQRDGNISKTYVFIFHHSIQLDEGIFALCLHTVAIYATVEHNVFIN